MEQQKEADNNVKPIRKEILNPGNKYIELTPGTRVSRTHTHTHTQTQDATREATVVLQPTQFQPETRPRTAPGLATTATCSSHSSSSSH